MADTYTMPYGCVNCGYECDVEIPKGAEAPNFFVCPNCGRRDTLRVKRVSKHGGKFEATNSGLRKKE